MKLQYWDLRKGSEPAILLPRIFSQSAQRDWMISTWKWKWDITCTYCSEALVRKVKSISPVIMIKVRGQQAPTWAGITSHLPTEAVGKTDSYRAITSH